MVENEHSGVHPDTIRRIDRLERDLSTLTDKVINLSDLAVQTNTNVENLITQVSGLFNRTQPKQTNWSVVIAALSLTALIGTLTLKPLYDEDAQIQEFNKNTLMHRLEDAKEIGRIETDLKWLKHMEDRNFDQIHSTYRAMSEQHNEEN
jgi:hypothetical protein